MRYVYGIGWIDSLGEIHIHEMHERKFQAFHYRKHRYNENTFRVFRNRLAQEVEWVEVQP